MATEFGDFNSQNMISIKQPKRKLICINNCNKKKDLKRISDSCNVSGISIFSNTSYYSVNNIVNKTNGNKTQSNPIQFQLPERCMYIVWERDPKIKYVPINEYDVGEKYNWYDEICDRLDQKKDKNKEFDEISQVALKADILEAIDKVEKNYFMGICDGSVIKVSDKLYVWRIDISHIEGEIILGPRSQLATSKFICTLPKFSFRPWRKLLRLYNYLRRFNLVRSRN